MTRADSAPGDRWAEIDRLFEELLDQPEPARAELLAQRAGGDEPLRRGVQALLDAVAASEGRFEAPGRSAAEAAFVDLAAREDPVPARVGAYEVIGEIGRGGMGSVYSATREGDGFRQTVAVKLLRRGLDTDDILQRFRNERRILASLTHPNIARLYDGGTTDDGRPYLVMEHVEGSPITAYCDAARLTVRARLALALHVIEAVSAAHAQLVVHRDLKPSNILVTRDGHVKLLDFGIAKLLGADEASGHTRTGVHVLTPEHASPEQLRGEPVTTATDVYQLGVLLFELLTGRLPYAQAPSSVADWMPAGDRGEPARPTAVLQRDDSCEAVARARSTTPDRLRAAVRGDLETVVLKALSPEPGRRYASTELLAQDIRLFLEDRPIAARPASRWYRTRKFAARHPWVMPAAALVATVFVAYAVLSARHTAQLERERNLARTESERADRVRRFLVALFRSADPSLPADPDRGRRITVVEALDLGAARLRTDLKDDPAERASLLVAVSDVYANLGVFDKARPLREEALSLELSLYGERSPQVRDSLGQLGRILGNLGEHDAALAHHERRVGLARAARPAATDLAAALLALGQHHMAKGQPDVALRHYEEIVALSRSGSVPLPDLAEAYRSKADAHQVLDRLDLAEAAARQALALKREVLGEDALGVGTAHITLAENLGATGDIAEAEQHFQAGLGILERRLGSDHGITLSSLNNLAVLRHTTGDLAGAEALHRRVLEIRQRVLGPVHIEVGASFQNLGTVVGQQGRHDEAEALHLDALDVYRQAARPGSYIPALPHLSLSSLHLKRGRHQAAESASRQARAILQAALPAGHYITAVAECRLAQALVGQRRVEESEPLFERATAALLETNRVPEYRDECFDAALALYDRLGRSDRATALRAARQPVDAPVAR